MRRRGSCHRSETRRQAFCEIAGPVRAANVNFPKRRVRRQKTTNRTRETQTAMKVAAAKAITQDAKTQTLFPEPNTRVKPNCVAQVTAWQASSAAPLPERSSFGLNELLGLFAGLIAGIHEISSKFPNFCFSGQDKFLCNNFVAKGCVYLNNRVLALWGIRVYSICKSYSRCASRSGGSKSFSSNNHQARESKFWCRRLH